MKKPTYYYNSRMPVTVGDSATLFGVEHPTLRANLIGTSTVVKFTEATGRIETQNSVYKPRKKKNGPAF